MPHILLIANGTAAFCVIIDYKDMALDHENYFVTSDSPEG